MALDLHKAAQKGDICLMNQLLSSRKVVVDKRDPYGGTPLHWACQSGEVEAINWLVSKGADVHAIATYDGKNALHFAVDSKKPDVIKCLLSLGVNPSHLDNSGATPRQKAEKAQIFDVLLALDSHCPMATTTTHYPQGRESSVQQRSDDQFQRQQQYTKEFFPQQNMDHITAEKRRYQGGEHLPTDNIATKMRQEGRWEGPSSSPSPSPSHSFASSPSSSFASSPSPSFSSPSFGCAECSRNSQWKSSLEEKERALQERERRLEERERDLARKEEDLTQKVQKFRAIVVQQRAQS